MESIARITCPSCGQTVINPAVSAENTIRCAACAHVFSLPVPEPIIQSGPDEPVAPPVVKLAPLGKEPLPTSYGLLQIVAWALLIALGAGGAWGLYLQFAGPRFITSGGMNIPIPAPPLTATLIGFLRDVGFSLVGIALASCIQRLDQRASWVAWRSGSLRESVSSPQGSSLPYILPWTVSGGVMVVFGIMLANRPADGDGGVTDILLNQSLGGGLVLSAFGGILFLIGLGCGEIRRFLWRMQFLGHAIQLRKRGEELGLGTPQRPREYVKESNSGVYPLMALPLLLILFGIIVWYLMDILSLRAMRGGSPPGDDGSSQLYAALTTAFVGIIGGCFTVMLLTRRVADALFSWELAAATISIRKRIRPDRSATDYFRLFAGILGVLIIGLQVLSVLFLPFGMPFIYKAFSLGGAVLAALFLFGLSSLKLDSFRLVSATMVFGDGRKSKTTARTLAKVLIVFAVIQFLATSALLIEQYIKVSTMFTTRGSPGMETGALLSVAMTFLVAVSVTSVPIFWIAMLLLDLDRAAANLDACVEVPPSNPAGAPPQETPADPERSEQTSVPAI